MRRIITQTNWSVVIVRLARSAFIPARLNIRRLTPITVGVIIIAPLAMTWLSGLGPFKVSRQSMCNAVVHMTTVAKEFVHSVSVKR